MPSWYYEIVAPGFKYNLTDIAAALGLHQLKKARAFQQRRAEIAALYQRRPSRLPVVPPPDAPAGETARLAPVRRCACRRRAIGRERFIERLFEAGIGCSVHYIPLHQQPYWRDRYGLEPAQISRTASAPTSAWSACRSTRA